MNCRPFAEIEHTGLQGIFVCHFAHFTAERINFTHKMPL